MSVIDEDLVIDSITHMFRAGWRGRYTGKTHEDRLIGATSAKSMQKLAGLMDLDIPFEEIELEIDLGYLQGTL